jgi:xanthine dehydrogenase YagT iron-sulfur-binding subunit
LGILPHSPQRKPGKPIDGSALMHNGVTMSDEPKGPEQLSRRSFLKSAGGVAAGGVLTHGAIAETGVVPVAEPTQDSAKLSGEVRIELKLNGAVQKLTVEPRTTLLSALRNKLVSPDTGEAMTGTKEVCDRGNCGACTVMLDGRLAYACMSLAIDCVGREIRTVEGLGTPDEMSDVQQAFCQHDAMMCGFCTPGFVVSTTALLEGNPDPSLDEIKSGLSGNICRCGTYPHIFKAAETVAASRSSEGGSR